MAKRLIHIVQSSANCTAAAALEGSPVPQRRKGHGSPRTGNWESDSEIDSQHKYLARWSGIRSQRCAGRYPVAGRASLEGGRSS